MEEEKEDEVMIRMEEKSRKEKRKGTKIEGKRKPWRKQK